MTGRMARSRKLPTGVGGLDLVLSGGLMRGAAYIVHGPPGAGKTILSNQICFNHTERGEVALYVSMLAESHDRMMHFMEQMGFFVADRVPALLTYLSAYQTLQKEGLPGVMKLLAHEVGRRNATLVVVDGLFVVHDAAEDADFRRFIHEIQGQAAMTGATFLLLTNQRRDPSSPEYTMVDGWIELLDEAHELRALRSLAVHKQRGGSFLRGHHYFRITDHGIRVFPRTEVIMEGEASESSGEARVTSGIAAFDTMLGGGYPGSSATLLFGPTGAGKSTLGLQFLSQSTPEAPGILLGFFERPARLIAKAKAIGIDLKPLLESGALEIIWRSPADNLIDELCHDLVEAVQRTGARYLVVDGLGPFIKSLRYKARLPLVVGALNHRLRSLGVTALYTHENNELFLPDDLHTDDLSSMIDNVILVHYALRDGVLRRNITIIKLRDSDFDSISEEFHISGQGIVFGEKSNALARPEGAVSDPTTGENTQRGVTRRTRKRTP